MTAHRETYAEDGSLIDVDDAVHDARRYAYETEIRRGDELAPPFSEQRETAHASNSNHKRSFGPRISNAGRSPRPPLKSQSPSSLLKADSAISLITTSPIRVSKRRLRKTSSRAKRSNSKDVVAQAADILRRASDAGFGLVVDLEYSHGDALAAVAKDYADADYVILNQVKPGANVASVLFQEQEGSYLAGALATLVAKDTSIKGMSGKPVIGVIGGTKSVGIDKFIVGYIEGARAIDPNVEVKVAYSNNFGDPAIGLQMAKAMFDSGANVVYQVAGGTGLGVIQAAKEAGKFAVGVDTDQDGVAPGAVLTSMIKRTDVAVETVMKDYAEHKFPGRQDGRRWASRRMASVSPR